MLSGFLRPHGTRTVVSVRPLADLLQANAIDAIDVLSLDTEGTELDVWNSFDHTAIRPKLIIIEWDTRGLPDKTAQILDEMSKAGFRHEATLGGNLLFV
jgi:hypothetical protein